MAGREKTIIKGLINLTRDQEQGEGVPEENETRKKIIVSEQWAVWK